MVYAIRADVPMQASGALDNQASIAAPVGFNNTNTGHESSVFTLHVTAAAAATVVAVPSLNTLALVLLALGLLVLAARQRRYQTAADSRLAACLLALAAHRLSRCVCSSGTLSA